MIEVLYLSSNTEHVTFHQVMFFEEAKHEVMPISSLFKVKSVEIAKGLTRQICPWIFSYMSFWTISP